MHDPRVSTLPTPTAVCESLVAKDPVSCLVHINGKMSRPSHHDKSQRAVPCICKVRKYMVCSMCETSFPVIHGNSCVGRTNVSYMALSRLKRPDGTIIQVVHAKTKIIVIIHCTLLLHTSAPPWVLVRGGYQPSWNMNRRSNCQPK